jgi:permuted papain-like amidase YaeF/Yiix C92 family enzyme
VVLQTSASAQSTAIQIATRSPWSHSGLVEVAPAARAFLGKKYDDRFEWSDDRIYCSELVAKAYQRGAHLGAGRLQRIRDLDIAPILAAARARYGDRIPLDREVLTPASLAEDAAFVAVHDDFHPPN